MIVPPDDTPTMRLQAAQRQQIAPRVLLVDMGREQVKQANVLEIVQLDATL